jgi:hypothetical protein
LRLFASPNRFDDYDINDIVLDSNDLASLGNLKKLKTTQNEYAQLFLESITQLINDASSFITIFEMVKNKENISIENFREIDWFPTKTYIPRYYLEIVDIVTRRNKVYSKSLNNQTLMNQTKFMRYFKSEYKGSALLRISRKDSDKVLKSIKALIEEEQFQFVKYLNDSSIDIKEKEEKYMLRRYVNRFTIEND